MIGCVDGTHISIQRSSQNEADLVNRKGYHSINVQAICDHRVEELEIFLYFFLGENMLSGFFNANLSIKTFLTRFLMSSARTNHKCGDRMMIHITTLFRHLYQHCRQMARKYT